VRRIATPTVARPARTAAAALPAALLACAACLAACGPENTATLDQSLQAYDAKRWAECQRLAQAAQAESQDPATRQRAAYVAGCAAYQLNHDDDAKALFAIAARSADRDVAGRAMLQQAAIAVEDKRWADAERLYLAAADKLPPPAAVKARTQADAAHDLVQSAQRPKKVARDVDATGPGVAPPASPPGSIPAAPVAPLPDNGRWTVVAGTFASETSARQRATTLASQAKRAGLPVPKVYSMASGGRRLWVVEIGIFDSRVAAEAARKKIPVTDSAVALSQSKAPA
jgi:hypothetical protein